ncbi:hypothetical protein [Rhizomonospora bruguierae]|uniref:hypothetical protein n=1 Tax=Rhizomonospora bruguierae TaxID=1581705 RepID=UPI001BCCED3E|nr:hypothetical protein [Micromonospora sp. NBRC 107566]
MAQVRLTKDWKQHRAGETVEVDASTLDMLKKEGIVAGDGGPVIGGGGKTGPVVGDGWGGDT